MGIIFTLLMKFIVTIANFFLAPINALVVNAFPSLTDKINYFESLINRFFTPLLSYFFQILPTNTRGLVLLYLVILFILYTLSLSIHLIIKVIEIIKAIKIW